MADPGEREDNKWWGGGRRESEGGGGGGELGEEVEVKLM